MITTVTTWLFNPGYPLIVLLGTTALLGILTFTLGFFGIICHLIYKSGNIKIEKMYKLKVSKA